MAILSVLTVVVIGCSTQDDQEPSDVPIPAVTSISTTPIPEPSATVVITIHSTDISPAVTRTATVTAAELPVIEPLDLPDLAVSDLVVNQCRVRGVFGANGLSGQGTAPAPTPTQIAGSGSRSRELIVSEVGQFRANVSPIVESLNANNEAFWFGWQGANTAEKQSAQLFVFGNRLSQLCSAVSQLEVPPELFAESVGLVESIRARYSWIQLAKDEVICCGTGKSDFLRTGGESTYEYVRNTTVNLVNRMDEYGSENNQDSGRVVSNSRFGMSLEVGSNAYLIGNSVELLIGYNQSVEILDPEYLKTTRWSDGTGIRIRRLRNDPKLSDAELLENHAGIISRYGETLVVEELDILEIDEFQFRYLELDHEWTGSVTLFINDGFTYFVEVMCAMEESEVCVSAHASVSSIRLDE